MVADSTEVGEPVKLSEEERATLDYIRRLLDESKPAAGSLAEHYLRSRCIKIVPPVLRFAPRLPYGKSGRRFPAMLAPIVDVKGELIGLHRTYLAADGSGKADVEKPKLMLGRAKGGAVRLTDCGSKLAIAEGIETALSVLVEEKVPTWAALSTSGLTTIELPRSVLEAVIYADADSAGIEAARAARRRLSALGHAVEVLRPNAPHKDYNDLLREVIGEGVEA